MTIEITTEQIRSLMNMTVKSGTTYSGKDAEAFMLLYQERLRVILLERVKSFVHDKIQ